MVTSAALIDGRPSDPVWPVVCSASTDGFAVFVPHPADCTLYFECDGDVPILMACPVPLFFDPSLNVCNWPDQVDCTIQEAETTTEEVVETTTEEVVEETTTAEVVEETTTAEVVEETTTEEVVEETTTQEAVEETTTQGAVEETTTQEAVEETTTQGVVEETTTQEAVQETTTKQEVHSCTIINILVKS